MDRERNLLFGMVAFQNGAVDADRLAETCAAWVREPSQTLAELFVDRGLMTDEQKTELEKVVADELEAHGGDPQATLVATIDGRSLEAIRDAVRPDAALEAQLNLLPHVQGSHVVLGTLSPNEESRERYTLTHLHAKGGMGRVWLARDGALGRQIALKELRPDQADNSIVCSRFLYEAKITAQLEHPGIVPVYELGEGEVPYYTMRFVRGRTLGEAIRAHHKKRVAGEVNSVGRVELLTAFVNVCHAVAYAHSRGIIHRDLKGQNVVLGDFGEVMVLDWGLAKRVGPDQQVDGSDQETAIADPAPEPLASPLLDADPRSAVTCGTDMHQDDGLTLRESHDIGSSSASSSNPVSNDSAKDHTNPSSNGSVKDHSGLGREIKRESGAGPDGTIQGQLLGTPAYMAPEQAQGRHDLVDERTDVYGLGAILYEILTGRPPFIGPKTSEIIRKVCEDSPTPPRQILATIPPGLEGVCMKALRKPSAERYPTAAELAQEVQRYLADEPVKAYAEPWTSRVLRWARRHKTAVSAAAALLVTATIALAVSTVLVSREKTEAESQGQQARHAVQILTKVADIGFDDQLNSLQKEFLEEALQYYDQFTSRVAHDPAVRLEHGHVYQQMGDIQRKLGRLPESKQAYLKAIAILEPLASHISAIPESKRALARSRTLLADLLVRSGGNKNQVEPLYNQAMEAQRALAKAPAATAEDRLRLGQTLKSQADLLRLIGQFSQAKPVYDQALTVLEQAHAAAGPAELRNEIRNDLALAADARGLVYGELGEIKAAAQDFRRSLELLNGLVVEFPTVPRYRESLAKACNSLGVLEQDMGDLDAAETHLRQELPLVERLNQDFPDRPEHARELARTLYNLGIVLMARNRLAEVEPIFRRAIEVTDPIASKHPDDVQIRFDLAKCHHNLGELLVRKGNAEQAINSFLKAREISEALVKASPEMPRYSSLLAANLASLGFAKQAVNQPKVEEIYRAALAIYERLVTAHPDNVEYRIGQARCLRNLGPIVAAAGQADQAETMYQQALTALGTKDKGTGGQILDRLRSQAEVLNNLGDLRLTFGRPGAEETLRGALTIFESLVNRGSPSLKDRHNLAIAQNNLGELYSKLNRITEALPLLSNAAAKFEELTTEAPQSVEYQSQFGMILAKEGELLVQSGKLAEAKNILRNAVSHQRRAVKLGKDWEEARLLLGSHLVELANINLKLSAYKEAADMALEVPQAVPAHQRGQGCLDAARILARLVSQVSAHDELDQTDRDRLTRQYLGRTVILLREAIDSDARLADQIKRDADIKLLESRPEFQSIMNSLVKLVQ